MKRRDDNRDCAFQRFGKLARTLVDLLHHAVLVFELIDRVLKLLIKDQAIRDDDDRIENLLVLVVVQTREMVREPGDGIGLAGASRVLDQVVVP